jgi:Chromo (CHRromatin Organisation MOdifier) domain
MAAKSSLSAEESTSESDVFLNSSDSEQEEEYTVEEILAERLIDDSHPRYLVKWENYGEERCDMKFPVCIPSCLHPGSLLSFLLT